MSFEGSVFLWIAKNEGHAINDEFSAFLTLAVCVKPFPDFVFLPRPSFRVIKQLLA